MEQNKVNLQNFRMIDVGEKNTSRRVAIARGTITVSQKTMEMIRNGESPKGNILSIAEVAGIMAAKNTSNIIPLCHPLLLDATRIRFELDQQSVTAFCEVVCHGKTGVEMEALFGVNACLLTIYDLAKAIDPVIEINNIYLEKKVGGKSGIWVHPKVPQKNLDKYQSNEYSPHSVLVLTLSDRASLGIYEDVSGKKILEYFTTRGCTNINYEVIPDDKITLKNLILKAKEGKTDIVVLTGGTGIGQRDITPDVVKELSCKELIGFGELQRQFGSQFTKCAWLSRSSAYVVGESLVVLFPGSPKGVEQGLQAVGELITHAVRIIKGDATHAQP